VAAGLFHADRYGRMDRHAEAVTYVTLRTRLTTVSSPLIAMIRPVQITGNWVQAQAE